MYVSRSEATAIEIGGTAPPTRLPERSTISASARPVRLLPSAKGWILSNCAWAIAAFATAGSGDELQKRTRSSSSRGTSSGAGGT